MRLFSRVSPDERIAHVARRLGVGANPELIAASGSANDAIGRALAAADEGPAPDISPPPNWEVAYDREYAPIEKVGMWWVDQMIESRSPIRERLTWFWHDHFATSAEKADVGWMVWNQLSTLRQHSLGNFGEMMKAIAKDGAMLWYLDNEKNTVWEINENYGREALELHTVGIGNYSQKDVVEASRGFTGWGVNYPSDDGDEPYTDSVDMWMPFFNADDFDSEQKTLLGQTGNWDMDQTIDILLEQPQTAKRTASKLFAELVGLEPSDDVATELGRSFGGEWGYEIMPLVEAIVGRPEFLSDDAIGAKIRTPLEKTVSILQAFPTDISDEDYLDYWWSIYETGYYPYGAPNPAGYAKGPILLSPTSLVKTFELLWPLAEPAAEWDTSYVAERLGLANLSSLSRQVLDDAPHSGYRVGLAVASPEFATT